MHARSLVFTVLYVSTYLRRLIAIFVMALFVFGVLVVDAQVREGGRGASKTSHSSGPVYAKGHPRKDETSVQPHRRTDANSGKTRLLVAVLLASATPSR